MRKPSARDEEVSVSVSVQEAQAVERCLRLERGVQCSTPERVRTVLLAPRAPRPVGANGGGDDVRVTLFDTSTDPECVTLECVRILPGGLRRTALRLPRRALRAALRRHALQALFPDVEEELVPVLAVQRTRRLWTHESGWTVAIAREVAFHRVEANCLERTGQVALGIPDRCADGRAHLALAADGALLPPWLEQVFRGAARWDLIGEALSLLAPRPAGRLSGRELRLVPASV